MNQRSNDRGRRKMEKKRGDQQKRREWGRQKEWDEIEDDLQRR